MQFSNKTTGASWSAESRVDDAAAVPGDSMDVFLSYNSLDRKLAELSPSATAPTPGET